MVTTRGHAAPTHAPGVAGEATTAQAHATGTAAGATAAQPQGALATIAILPRPTENSRHAASAALAQVPDLGNRPWVLRLGNMFRLVSSGRSLWGMIPEIQEFVGLVKEMLADGTLTRDQLYNALISKSHFLRLEKIAKFELLQQYGLNGQLTVPFLDLWSLEQPLDEAGEEYAGEVGVDLLRKEGQASFASIFENFVKGPDRAKWEDEENPQTFVMPAGITLWNLSDEHCPYDKEDVRRQLPGVVNATLTDFVHETGYVRSWVDANGRNQRLYGIFHEEKLVGYLYQKLYRCGTRDVPLIQAYGMLEDYRGLGLGSAVNYRLLKDLHKFKYIIADIDRQHPDSLACLRRAVHAFGRRMVPLGRLNRDTGILDVNRRPREGECTEWCLQLENAPQIFTHLQPRKRWPRTGTEDEEDMSSTYLPEDGEGDETEEVEEEEEEEVQKPKRRRGRPLKRGQRKREKTN